MDKTVQFNGPVSDIENKQNKVEEITPNSTHDQYPSAKAVAKAVSPKADKIYLDNSFANAIKNTLSGEALTTSDVSPIEHSLNVSVESKNIIGDFIADPNTGWEEVLVTTDDNGVVHFTFTDNPDDSVFTVSPTSVGYYEGKTITITNFSVAENSQVIPVLDGYVDDGNLTEFKLSPNESATFNIPNGNTGEVQMFFYANSSDWETFDNTPVHFYPMITLGSEKPLSWSAPIRDFSNVKVSRYGKNLSGNPIIHKYDYSLDYRKYNSENEIILPKGTYRLSGTALPYMQFWDVKTKTAYLVSDVVKFNSNHYYSAWEGFCLSPASASVITTTIEIKKNVLITMACMSTELTDFQIEAGTNITEYEPPMEPQTATANADGSVEGLMSISTNMTLITDTSGAVINLEYNADTKKYIDNKFAELATALLNS